MKLQKIISVVCLLMALNGFSQQIDMEIHTTNFAANEKIGGATVRVFNDSTLLSSDITKVNGLAVVGLEPGKSYKIVVSAYKKVDRFLYVDLTAAKNLKKEDLEKLNGSASIGLFEMKENVDYSYVLNNPITTFSVDLNRMELIYDASQAEKMFRKVAELTVK